MRLGVLGGTFDPIHLGHLRAAENAREALGLDRVLFVPARVPPHRPEPRASGFDRHAMVALATCAHPAFVPSDLELRRDGPSFTVDTVSALAAEAGASVFLIVGSDTQDELPGWKDAARLQSLCTIAVVERPGAPPREPAAAVPARRVDGPGLEISASLVRRRLAEGRSVRYLVPACVSEYIQKRELYR